MLIPENIQIFQRSQKSIGYTHIWYDAGEKYQRQVEANLVLRAIAILDPLRGLR